MIRTFILVHGVGAPESGKSAELLAANLGLRKLRRRLLKVDGEPLIELRDEDSERSIVEVNWADIIRPRESMVGLLRYLAFLMTSMVDIASWHDGKSRAWCASAYRWALFTVTPGAVLFMLSTGVASSIDDDQVRRLAVVGVIGFAVIIIYQLSRIGRYFLWLLAWLALAATALCASWHDPLPNSHWLVELAKSLRGLGFALVIALLVFASIESWILRRKKSVKVRTAFLAMLYMPFIAMNGLMTALSLLALALLSMHPGYSAWETEITPHFDFASLEAVTTLVLGGLGIFAIAIPVGCYFASPRSPQAPVPESNERGSAARNGLAVFLKIAPIALLGLGAYGVFLSWRGDAPDATILETYGKSILRIVPYLAWLYGPFAVAFGVMGDVLFYLQPNARHPAAINAGSRARMAAALSYVAKRPPEEVMIVAHSQGSVIAADVCAKMNSRIPLLTLGSPISSLYQQLLGIDVPSTVETTKWVNAFREGDYIGGPIACANVSNRHWGPGGHTDYWGAAELKRLLAESASQK